MKTFIQKDIAEYRLNFSVNHIALMMILARVLKAKCCNMDLSRRERPNSSHVYQPRVLSNFKSQLLNLYIILNLKKMLPTTITFAHQGLGEQDNFIVFLELVI